MLGESLALAAAFGWVGSSIFLEKASKETGTISVNLIRLLMAMIFLGIITFFKRGMLLPFDVSREALKFLSISGLFGLFLGDFFLYKAYVTIGPRIVLLIMTLSPIMVSILSFFILKENILGLQFFGMLLTIAGIMIVILKKKSEKEFSKLGFVYAILAMLGESFGIIFTRLGSEGYDSFATIQVRTIPAILAFVIYISLTKKWCNIKEGIVNSRGMIYIVLGTIVATLGVTALVESMKYANVGVVSTLASTSPILIIPISIIFFREKVTVIEGVGALISFIGITIFFVL
ncbi:DMT family transporter [Candidatus Cetobacterium colombiensis]|uniref:DMT family transporter n=1 Tax=Candidatus Cetobacterium colombiensis TaxID=3073100 RepID=A0ABU4W9T0_9FUSO|nr:DMT family transporter [Candidatus Cetobacterium colombiensis]MDX8335454.1 DMT family transporter [Candidatus Cetobacterium colombiensis]